MWMTGLHWIPKLLFYQTTKFKGRFHKEITFKRIPTGKRIRKALENSMKSNDFIVYHSPFKVVVLTVEYWPDTYLLNSNVSQQTPCSQVFEALKRNEYINKWGKKAFKLLFFLHIFYNTSQQQPTTIYRSIEFNTSCAYLNIPHSNSGVTLGVLTIDHNQAKSHETSNSHIMQQAALLQHCSFCGGIQLILHLI